MEAVKRDGRGAGGNPKNRFEKLEYVPDPAPPDEEGPPQDAIPAG